MTEGSGEEGSEWLTSPWEGLDQAGRRYVFEVTLHLHCVMCLAEDMMNAVFEGLGRWPSLTCIAQH